MQVQPRSHADSEHEFHGCGMQILEQEPLLKSCLNCNMLVLLSVDSVANALVMSQVVGLRLHYTFHSHSERSILCRHLALG